MNNENDPVQELKEQLREIKEIVLKLKDEINLISKDDYFHKTPYQYKNGMLYLYDEGLDTFLEVPMSTQIEHERWQIRTFGSVDGSKVAWKRSKIEKEDYFKRTAFRYDKDGTLMLFDPVFDMYMSASTKVQREHEEWQRQTFGKVERTTNEVMPSNGELCKYDKN